MVEWRDPIEEDIEWNLESVSRITGGSTNGNGAIPALQIYEVHFSFNSKFLQKKLLNAFVELI